MNLLKKKEVEFSEIVNIEIEEIKGKISFILENGEIITENIKSWVKFVDPAYDSVFKTIFEEGNLIGEKE